MTTTPPIITDSQGNTFRLGEVSQDETNVLLNSIVSKLPAKIDDSSSVIVNSSQVEDLLSYFNGKLSLVPVSVGNLPDNYSTNDFQLVTNSLLSSINNILLDRETFSLLSIEQTNNYKGKEAKVINVFGRKSNCSTPIGYHYVTECNLWRDPPQILYITSTSNKDVDVIGTGVRKVTVSYINTLGEHTTTLPISLNSNTLVPTITDCSYILFISVVDAGIDKVSEGEICLVDSLSNVYEKITSFETRSHSARFKIPKGWTGYLYSFNYSNIRQSTNFKITSSDGYYFTILSPKDSNNKVDLNSAKVTENSEIEVKFKVFSLSVTPIIQVELKLILIKNDY